MPETARRQELNLIDGLNVVADALNYQFRDGATADQLADFIERSRPTEGAVAAMLPASSEGPRSRYKLTLSADAVGSPLRVYSRLLENGLLFRVELPEADLLTGLEAESSPFFLTVALALIGGLFLIAAYLQYAKAEWPGTFHLTVAFSRRGRRLGGHDRAVRRGAGRQVPVLLRTMPGRAQILTLPVSCAWRRENTKCRKSATGTT